MAMSADGKIATADREAIPQGSPRDLARLLRLRTAADAVMCGARTLEAGPIKLGPGPVRYRRLRQSRGLSEYNLRIIASGSGTVSLDAEIFRHRFSPIIILVSERASAAQLRRLAAVADEVKVTGKNAIDFPKALAWLRQKWGVNRLHCEGGGELNGALFAADLVDEVHLTICPAIIGGRNAPTIADGIGIPKLAQAITLELVSLKRLGPELFLTYRRIALV
jgi:riboflavin-specific deaminase-like protein